MASTLRRIFTLTSQLHLAAVRSTLEGIPVIHRYSNIASVTHDLPQERPKSDISNSRAAEEATRRTTNIISTKNGLRNITLVDPSGTRHAFRAADGETVLDIAKSKELEIEGACEGQCACSTCHIIVASREEYEKLPPTTEKEEDMLDLAFGLTSTSRLACQVKMTPALDGIRIKLPGVARDARPTPAAA